MRRDLQWAREAVSRLVNYNVDEPNKDFSGPASNPYSIIDECLNEAKNEIIWDAVLNASQSQFQAYEDYTWSSGVALFTFPHDFDPSSLIQIDDITNGVPGYPLWVSRRDWDNSAHVWWATNDTLRWGADGPSSDTTIRVSFIGGLGDLVNPTDEPAYIPQGFRDYWKWNAAVIARERIDEDRIPASWRDRVAEYRARFRQAAHQGWPRDPHAAGLGVPSKEIL